MRRSRSCARWSVSRVRTRGSTFTCRDGRSTAHGEPIEDAVRARRVAAGRRGGRQRTAPQYVDELLSRIRAVRTCRWWRIRTPAGRGTRLRRPGAAPWRRRGSRARRWSGGAAGGGRARSARSAWLTAGTEIAGRRGARRRRWHSRPETRRTSRMEGSLPATPAPRCSRRSRATPVPAQSARPQRTRPAESAARLGREPPRVPGAVGAARERLAVVQAVRAALPELDHVRHEPVAAPVRRARHLARIGRVELASRASSHSRSGITSRLARRPGAELRAARAGREVLVGLLGASAPRPAPSSRTWRCSGFHSIASAARGFAASSRPLRSRSSCRTRRRARRCP